MKTLQKKAAYSIVTNDKYICIIGNSLSVYNKSYFTLVCSFSKPTVFYHAAFLDENILIAKSYNSTTLIYSVFDINKTECVKTYKFQKLKSYQDVHFILSPDGKFIFDVITIILSEDVRLYKINIETGEYENVILGKDVRVIKNILYDKKSDKLLIMHDRGTDDNCTGICTVTEVDYQKMRCRDIFEKSIPISNFPITLFDTKYLLFRNMEVVDITNNIVVKNINFSFIRMNYTYIQKGYYDSNMKYIFLIFSDKIIVIDYFKNEVIKEFNDRYCSDAKIIDNQILIGTWDKAYLSDFIVD